MHLRPGLSPQTWCNSNGVIGGDRRFQVSQLRVVRAR